MTASKLTNSIPIVFVANQGEFVTGLEPLMREQGDKTNLMGVITTNPTERRFELMMEIVPTIQEVFVPYDPTNPLSVESLGLLETAATEQGVTILPH